MLIIQWEIQLFPCKEVTNNVLTLVLTAFMSWELFSSKTVLRVCIANLFQHHFEYTKWVMNKKWKESFYLPGESSTLKIKTWRKITAHLNFVFLVLYIMSHALYKTSFHERRHLIDSSNITVEKMANFTFSNIHLFPSKTSSEY